MPIPEEYRSEFTLEELDRLDRSIAKLTNTWNDECQVLWPRLLKRYLGDNIFRIQLRCRIELSDGQTDDFSAILDWGPYRVRVLPIYDGESDRSTYRIDVTNKVAEQEPIA